MDILATLLSCLEKLNTDQATTITTNEVSKPNNIVRKAICIHHHNSNIGCNYYVDDLERRYSAGESIESIAADIMEHSRKDNTFQNNSFLTSLLSNLSSYEVMKDNILIRLLNLKENNEYLTDKVYYPFIESGDSYELAICLSIRVPANDDTLGTIAVTKQLRSKWDIGDEDLLKKAIENTVQHMGWKFQNIFDVISHLLTEKDAFSGYMNPPEPSMFVLTNNAGCNGAATLVYPDRLKEIAEHLNKDLFIIPSSIHELIIIPDDGTIQADNLIEMITQVNQTEVDPADVLSNKLFYYSRSTNCVSIAKTTMED